MSKTKERKKTKQKGKKITEKIVIQLQTIIVKWPAAMGQ